MRPIILAISLVLPCVGCVAAPPPEPVISEVTTKASPDNQACHGYTAQAVIDGKLQPIVGRACQQPDGTWIIVEGPAETGLTNTSPCMCHLHTLITPMSIHGFGPHRLGSALARFIFVDHDHHFHDGHRFAHFGHMHRFEGRHGLGRSGGGGRLG